MAFFVLFLGFVFALWRFAVEFIPKKKRSRPLSRKEIKYIVLRGPSKGDITEELPFNAQPDTADRIAVRVVDSREESTAEHLLSDVAKISNVVADLLLAIRCPVERHRVYEDHERIDAGQTRVVPGSHVFVKLGENEDEIAGVVMYKGPVGPANGTMFGVQLTQEEEDAKTESTVLFKGKKYFSRRSDPSVFVFRDNRVLVPISKLTLQTSEAAAAATRTQQSPWQLRESTAATAGGLSLPSGEPGKRTRGREPGKRIPDRRESRRELPTAPAKRKSMTQSSVPVLPTRNKTYQMSPVREQRSDTHMELTASELELELVPPRGIKRGSQAVVTAPVKRRSYPDSLLTTSEREHEPVPSSSTRRRRQSDSIVGSEDALPPQVQPCREQETVPGQSSDPTTVFPSMLYESGMLMFDPSHYQQTASLLNSNVVQVEDREGGVASAGLVQSLGDAPLSDRRPLLLGQRVVAFDWMERMLRGQVRYIADKENSNGNILVGIELDEPHGSGRGMLDGKQHFICAKDYALFVPSGAVLSEDDFEGKPLTDKTDAPNDPEFVIVETSRMHPKIGDALAEETLNSTEDLLRVSSLQRLPLEEQLLSMIPEYRTANRGETSELEQLRAELRQVSSTKERQIEQLRAEMNEVSSTKARQLEELRTALAEVTDTKARQLERLRTELREVSSTRERLERTLQQERENFERERNQLRRHQPLSADWTISRNEVHMTDKYLGKGAWASVSVGIFRGLEVAVKQIHDLILSDYNRELFAREMQMASRCRHPCLLQFIGATSDDGQALLITELLDKNLRSVLSERSLSKEEIVAIALDVSRALNYLHLNKPLPIIHRDISSANVLLWRRDNCWRAKVSDYGTANFMRQCATISPGAPLYVAPEALCATRQSPKMDVYSFGVLLCEMCIRQLPATSPQKRQEQIDQVRHTVLRNLVTTCVRPDPDERPDMADVLRELEKLVTSSDENGPSSMREELGHESDEHARDDPVTTWMDKWKRYLY